MKRKASLAIVLTLVLIGSMIWQSEAYAELSYCDVALTDCLGKCGSSGGWISGGASLFGNGWIGFAWTVGCGVGCHIGYSNCGNNS